MSAFWSLVQVQAIISQKLFRRSCAIWLSNLSNAAKLQATVGLQGKDEEQHPQQTACVVLT